MATPAHKRPIFVAGAAAAVGAAGTLTASRITSPTPTIIHVAVPYGDTVRHHYIVASEIVGLGGPFPWRDDGYQSSNMQLYTSNDAYPVCKLPDRGSDELNQEWASAIEAVIRTRPGGIVTLEDYLP